MVPRFTLRGPREGLRQFLDEKVVLYNRAAFISHDPVSIPHRFSRPADIEIAGFFAAIFAWGQRVTVINKTNELLALMEHAPYDFLLHHTEKDLKRFLSFRHRTFNATDALYTISFLAHHFRRHGSLEVAFPVAPADEHVEEALVNFQKYFFSLPHAPGRTRKHIPTPERKSACKRLNMFLRWMVRSDRQGVDFGLWKSISPAQLICPCDVHVERVARKLRLITRKGTGWQTALELTRNLKLLDARDPVKYDFALFGLGIVEKLQAR
jgi:uncharacterized protein (TIGR02757 family)